MNQNMNKSKYEKSNQKMNESNKNKHDKHE